MTAAPVERSPAERSPVEAPAAELLARLGRLEVRVREAVERRRADDPDADDRFRGLYVSDAHVERLLAGGPGPLLPAPPPLTPDADDGSPGAGIGRLARLRATFGLDALDEELLLIALAPDVDPRFERLYAYLQDDVSRRRASTGLALELATGRPGSAPDRHRLGATAALRRAGLLLVEDADRPFLTRALRVPDRVTGHLLGDDTPDPVIAALADPDPFVSPATAGGPPAALAGEGPALWYVREGFGTAGRAAAIGLLRTAGRPVLALDLTRLDPGDDIVAVAMVAGREARLTGAALVAGPIEAIEGRGVAAIRAFAELPGGVVLIGARAWDPGWSRRPPVFHEPPPFAPGIAEAAWSAALGEDPLEGAGLGAVRHLRLAPEQVARAAQAALQQARAEGRSLTPEDLTAGARAQNASGLERLANRIRPAAGWDDLVLPGEVVLQLRELAARTRHRELVRGRWGMGGGSSRGRGIAALFAGDSGTGKTLSAEVLAGDLGLDLYVIDLSSVIDKYIGETEKNLDRVFAEADRVNGVLLFDEADALFGKRSDVRDAHDRYANVEIAYLLQRMERFDGVAILTTNLRANLDDAFTRRLDALIDFPLPEEEDRLRLWERHLPAAVPRSPDVDLVFLASAFRLPGGNIRNITLAAAFLAADDGRPVTMAHLIHATGREYQKLGRLCLPAEFGPYHHLLRSLGGAT